MQSREYLLANYEVQSYAEKSPVSSGELTGPVPYVAGDDCTALTGDRGHKRALSVKGLIPFSPPISCVYLDSAAAIGWPRP